MAYWIEVHCDTPQTLVPMAGGAARCDRESGAIPGASGATPARAALAVEGLAKERGYTYDHEVGWQCPRCQRGRRYEEISHGNDP